MLGPKHSITVNMKDDNKDVQVLTDNLNLLEEIQRNNMKEQEVQQVLKKEDELTWEQDGIIYMEGRIYISNNKTSEKGFYGKIMTLWM